MPRSRCMTPARSHRPQGADRSVHFRCFELAGKTIYRWDSSLDVPVK